MKFCSECGGLLQPCRAEGRDHPHYRCPACGAEFRDHPRILAACFVRCGRRLLWMRRKLAPQRGYWAIPAGFVESGETMVQAAARELHEETGVVLPPERLSLYMMGTVSFISEVYVAFHGEVARTDCHAGDDALEARFFSREELPWEALAYPQANHSIIQAYDDIESGTFGLFHCEMTSTVNRLDRIPEEA